MLISATGIKRGFTLVEMLVVLVIMGLLSSAVVLMLPKQGGLLRDDARALAARAKLAAQESIITGAPTGLLVTQEGYAFYRREGGNWVEWTGERAFQRKVFRTGVVADVKRSGNVATRAAATFSGATVPVRATPGIVFDPTGVATAFSVSLTEKGEKYLVSNNEKGEVVVHAAP
jgi:general secretion pathway protein H